MPARPLGVSVAPCHRPDVAKGRLNRATEVQPVGASRVAEMPARDRTLELPAARDFHVGLKCSGGAVRHLEEHVLRSVTEKGESAQA